jgi:Lipocalin-like domain
MHKWILGLVLAVLLPCPALAADNELNGTYRLVSSQRRILDTGQVVDSYGKDPKGFIMYGRDDRFLVLITNGGRPKAPSIDKITSEQAEELFRTMLAYGGTYTFDGRRSNITSISLGMKSGPGRRSSGMSRKRGTGWSTPHVPPHSHWTGR